VYAAFIGLIGSIPSQGVPYGVFALTGMTVWLPFGSGLTRVSESTVSGAPLISKIWFPRLIIPLSAIGPAVIDLAASALVLLVVMLLFGVIPEPKIVLLPVAALVAFTASLGIGLWFSAISVRYRDIQQIVPFLLLVLLFLTPIIYPFEVVPPRLQAIYSLNPLVGMVEFFRWTVIPDAPFPDVRFAITIAFLAIVVPSGLLFFERRQHLFADVI
jgi:lipopolysaccharide transport system permease protein